MQYAYDADSNRTTLYYSGSQRPVSYSYDPLDRLSTVTDWNNAQTVYYYDNAGRLVTEALPSGTGIDHYFAYDNANRLTNVSYVQGSTTLVWGGYTLDADGNRTSKTFTGPYLPSGGGTEYYCLDALNRLTSVRTAAGCTGGSQTEGYAYDNVGNRTSLTTAAGTTGYSYDHAGQRRQYLQLRRQRQPERPR